jgi:hypothetical protein
VEGWRNWETGGVGAGFPGGKHGSSDKGVKRFGFDGINRGAEGGTAFLDIVFHQTSIKLVEVLPDILRSTGADILEGGAGKGRKVSVKHAREPKIHIKAAVVRINR